MLTPHIWALHGFLGLPSDWDGFGVTAVKIEPADSMQLWAKKFNQQVEKTSKDRKNILLGYSLGGRLALHALEANPNLWASAILVSTHPGIKKGFEARFKQDEYWAERFLQDPWEDLIKDWNAQAVFEGSQEPNREETDYSRKDLACYLRNFSVSKQRVSLPSNVTFVVGERDNVYRSLLPKALLVPDAGHRVHFDNPQALKQIISSLASNTI